MSASPLRFSIVIPTHRRPGGLVRLLDSLAAQAEASGAHEIVVVNDGSHSAAYEAGIAPHRGRIRYLVAAQNGGPATARNLGIAAARGAFIVFIDDDCVAPPGWLDRLGRTLDAEPALDAVGGTTRPLPAQEPRWFERLLTASHAHPNPIHYRGQLIVMVSACLAVRRTMLQRLGGFQEKVMPLAEDRNLTTRLRLAGARCAIAPDWFVLHDMSSTVGQHFRRYFNYGRGVCNAIALEEEPLDRDYWPPPKRGPAFWLQRAVARLHEAPPTIPAELSPAERLPLLALAAATNFAMDVGYVYAERQARAARAAATAQGLRG